MILRAEFLVPIESYSRISGQPFKVSELREAIVNTITSTDPR